MKVFQSYIFVMEKVNKIVLGIVAIMLFLIFALLVSQVFFRYVVQQSLSWTDEAARYLTIWLVFLGTSLCLRDNSLIAVEAIVQFIPPHIKKAFKIVVLSLTFIFALFLTKFGLDKSLEVVGQNSIALNIPMWIPYASIPVGGIYILLNTVVVMIEIISEERRN